MTSETNNVEPTPEINDDAEKFKIEANEHFKSILKKSHVFCGLLDTFISI
jgi:hypothetical protein